MAKQMSEEEIYELAKKRVEDKKGFFNHLTVYVLVNIVLIIVWAFPSGRGFPWFLFPLCGWGIGVVFHFLGVFVFSRTSDRERKAIEKEAEKIRRGG